MWKEQGIVHKKPRIGEQDLEPFTQGEIPVVHGFFGLFDYNGIY